MLNDFLKLGGRVGNGAVLRLQDDPEFPRGLPTTHGSFAFAFILAKEQLVCWNYLESALSKCRVPPYSWQSPQNPLPPLHSMHPVPRCHTTIKGS